MDYRIKIDDFDNDLWRQCAAEFMDYNLYQTPAYQQVRAQKDSQSISRFIIQSDGGQTVLMGQLRIKKVSLLGLRIGYIQWGPLCRKCDGIVEEPAVLFQMLKEAYVPSRVNVLRIAPNIFESESKGLDDQICSSGFEKQAHIKPYRTMLFPLDKDEEGIRKQFHSGWRRYLNKALKANLDIRQGTDAEYIDVLQELYADLTQRKGFEGLSVDTFVGTQQNLSDSEKINAVAAAYEQEILTVHTTSHLGDTALGILAASSKKARQANSAYLVWWHTLIAAKDAGMKRYDLAGIDPEKNPQVYQFKQRMGAIEDRHIGIFEAYASKRVQIVWRIAEKAYSCIKGK